MNDLITDIAQILSRQGLDQEFARATYMVEQMKERFDQQSLFNRVNEIAKTYYEKVDDDRI